MDKEVATSLLLDFFSKIKTQIQLQFFATNRFIKERINALDIAFENMSLVFSAFKTSFKLHGVAERAPVLVLDVESAQYDLHKSENLHWAFDHFDQDDRCMLKVVPGPIHGACPWFH